MSDFKWPAQAFEPPFFDQERGGGKITDWMKAKKRIADRRRLKEVSEEIRSIKRIADINLSKRTLPALEAEARELRESLGYLRLVPREVA